MRRFWSGVLVAAVLTTAGLSAQAASQGAGEKEPAGQAGEAGKSEVGKVLTVNGCLQTAAAGAGAATTTSRFVLAVKPAPGAGGGGGRGSAGTRYRLDGEDKIMTPHLNHVVEVNGTVQPPGAGAASGEILLKVAWVKMVAATCS